MYREMRRAAARLRWRTRASTRWFCSATATSCTPPAPAGRCWTPACHTSSGRWRSCSPTTSIRTCSCRSARAPRRSRRSPPTTFTAPLYLEFDEGVEHFARVLADLIPPGASGRGRRADRRDAPGRRQTVPRGSAVGCRAGGRPGQAGQDHRPDRLYPQGVSHHRGGGGRRPEGVGPGSPPDRPVGDVRAPCIRTRRDREHARCDLAGDARLAGRRGRGPRTATWRCRC